VDHAEEVDVLRRQASRAVTSARSQIRPNKGGCPTPSRCTTSITIRLLQAEPDFDSTLSWLQRDNDDDRIIAATLEYQRQVPSSIVVLVTEDINMQNKAEAAKLPYDELPGAP
jgi:predicted ribonuclease YlaK